MPLGYPDASRPRARAPCADGRRPGARHGARGLGVSAGSAGPPPARSGAAPLHCMPTRSSDCPGRTTSTGTPPRCTSRRQTAGNRDAGPGLQGLDTDAETGNDSAARSVSSRLTRGTEVLPQTTHRLPRAYLFPRFSPNPSPHTTTARALRARR